MRMINSCKVHAVRAETLRPADKADWLPSSLTRNRLVGRQITEETPGVSENGESERDNSRKNRCATSDTGYYFYGQKRMPLTLKKSSDRVIVVTGVRPAS